MKNCAFTLRSHDNDDMASWKSTLQHWLHELTLGLYRQYFRRQKCNKWSYHSKWTLIYLSKNPQVIDNTAPRTLSHFSAYTIAIKFVKTLTVIRERWLMSCIWSDWHYHSNFLVKLCCMLRIQWWIGWDVMISKWNNWTSTALPNWLMKISGHCSLCLKTKHLIEIPRYVAWVEFWYTSNRKTN